MFSRDKHSTVNSFFKYIQHFHENESGATATEYIVLLILVACFIILVVKQFGQTISEKFGWADERVTKFVVF